MNSDAFFRRSFNSSTDVDLLGEFEECRILSATGGAENGLREREAIDAVNIDDVFQDTSASGTRIIICRRIVTNCIRNFYIGSRPIGSTRSARASDSFRRGYCQCLVSFIMDTASP